MTNPINPIAIIPHYNHSNTVGNVIAQLQQLGLPVLIVDDGSTAEHQQTLKQFEHDKVIIVFRPENGGKGAAVKTGLQEAFARGFSHALQVDADGQHNLTDTSELLRLANQSPQAVVCGAPIYRDDAPKARLYGRKITNFWLAINTLSFDIKDGMCGFRLYPLTEIMPIITHASLGDRMDFDIEILVHCHWHSIPFKWFNTPVSYNNGGVSHFRGWADNWLISKMHARLFFGMLRRLLTGKIR